MLRGLVTACPKAGAVELTSITGVNLAAFRHASGAQNLLRGVERIKPRLARGWSPPGRP